MVEIGIESGAQLIAFEKPVAMTSAEGLAIKKALERAGVKAVVSHQHRYGEHYQRVKKIIASGAIGNVHSVYGTATGWAAHMLSHLIDYTSWFNNYEPAEWVMGQAAGAGKLADAHASPDYVAGVVHFRNGVRGVYDCGAGAPDVPDVPYWWRKCRIGAIGSEGMPKSTPEAAGARSRRTASNQGRGTWTTTTTCRPTCRRLPAGWKTIRRLIRCDSSAPTTGSLRSCARSIDL